jgi:hypothetical protein
MLRESAHLAERSHRGIAMFDLSTWNLTIPDQGPKASVIETEKLNQGYNSEFFHPLPDGSGVVFWAPVGGSHTKNSHYPRSELRETKPDGSLYNWKYPGADHKLTATLSVNQLPSSNKIVIGQIHGVDTEDLDGEPLIKLQYRYKKDNGRIEALIREHPADHKSPSTLVADGIGLNQRFDYSIELTADGTLDVGVTDQTGRHSEQHFKVDPSWAEQSLYFKAGAYVQDNKGGLGEGGKVTFYQLQNAHTAQ